jgi:cytochrome c peroxidase
MRLQRLLPILLFGAVMVAMTAACRKDSEPDLPPSAHVTTPFPLVIPPFFPPMDIPADNPLTVEGVRLGRFLFWEKKLSGNNAMSCGSCHLPEHGFSDPQRFSTGITGAIGTRQSMPLVNLGWATSFFWDGRARTLEEQIIEPIPNPIEMNETWDNATAKLRNDPAYPPMFKAAFGSEDITQDRVTKAIASFLRTMISANSKFDQQRRGEYILTPEEENGFTLFMTEGGDPDVVIGGQGGADCFHCHSIGGLLFTDHSFQNNGLDSHFSDLGRYLVTFNSLDSAKFKTPTLRNSELTAPYMHDGRFNTLDEVVDHYNSGGHPSTTVSSFMKYQNGGLGLSDASKQNLIAFLKCLTDTSFIHNSAFSDPH